MPLSRHVEDLSSRPAIRTLALALVVAAIAAAAYVSTCGGEFIYDDIKYIVENPVVASGSFGDAFTKPLPPDQPHLGLFRPLVVASWAAQARWQGLDPLPFHVFNLLAHAAVAAATFGFALALGSSRAAAFLGAALFALHPAHVEAVAWITGRSELLAALFLLLALVGCTKVAGPLRVLLVSVAVALAAMSKENAFTFPALLLLVAVARPALDRRTLLAAGGAALAVLALFAIWRIGVLGRFAPEASLAPFVNEPLATRLLIPFDLLAHYLRLFFWPVGLRPFYHRREFGIPGPWQLVLLALFAALLCLTWRRSRRGFALLAWFPVALLPVLNVVPIQETFAERFWYLPSIGLCLAAGEGLAWLARREKARLGSLALSALVPTVALPALLTLTVIRNRDWRTSLALWEANARDAPQFAYSHYQLGYYYEQRGIIEPTSPTQRGAIAEYLESLRLDPNHMYVLEAHRQLGKLFLKKQHWREAAAQFRKALDFEPTDFTSLFDLAYCARFVADLMTEEQRRGLLEQARRAAPDESARARADEELKAPMPKKM